MKPTLEQIILDWIGEDVTFSSKENERYNSGYALALSDLRARVPELVEKIEVSIEDFRKETRIRAFEEVLLELSGVTLWQGSTESICSPEDALARAVNTVKEMITYSTSE